ncbi:MAG: hypothetical protein ACKPE1_22310, partial [Dolichospermum sp.]
MELNNKNQKTLQDIFENPVADKGQLENWERMLLSHTGACTDILAEHYDGSKKPIPEPGYRLKEFSQIEEYVDPEFPGASTHYRIGDWEVSKVEEYRGFRSYEVHIKPPLEERGGGWGW